MNRPTRKPRVIRKRAALPVNVNLTYVLCFNCHGEYYSPAATWGFDSLGTGNGIRPETARAVKGN